MRKLRLFVAVTGLLMFASTALAVGIVVPVSGESAQLTAYFKGISLPTSWTLRLFTDANACAVTDTYTTHTAESGGGYTDKSLTVAGATITAGNGTSTYSSVSWATQTFTFTGAATGVKGYIIYDNNNNVIACETLASTFTPATNGDYITVTPIIKLGNGAPTY